MPNEGYLCKQAFVKVLNNVVFDFSCYSLAHLEYIAVGLLLVGGAAQITSIWVKTADIVFYHFHVKGGPLEAMD
jgi:hypothetical protein